MNKDLLNSKSDGGQFSYSTFEPINNPIFSGVNPNFNPNPTINPRVPIEAMVATHAGHENMGTKGDDTNQAMSVTRKWDSDTFYGGSMGTVYNNESWVNGPCQNF